MKKLFLIRHAKSEWSIQGLPDIDRPLNKRGYFDAHNIGGQTKSMVDGKILFVSSPAIRAISTALIFAREINYNPGNIRIRRELYEAEREAYQKLIPSIEDDFDTVLIFGHNPTISSVVAYFSDSVADDLPTCAVSLIEFDIKKWEEIVHAKGRLEKQLFPIKPAP